MKKITVSTYGDSDMHKRSLFSLLKSGVNKFNEDRMSTGVLFGMGLLVGSLSAGAGYMIYKGQDIGTQQSFDSIVERYHTQDSFQTSTTNVITTNGQVGMAVATTPNTEFFLDLKDVKNIQVNAGEYKEFNKGTPVHVTYFNTRGGDKDIKSIDAIEQPSTAPGMSR